MRIVRPLLLALLVMGPLSARPAHATGLPVPGPCYSGTLPSGALSLVCIPTSGWNGDLVVWAHGYVAFNAPLAIQNLTLPDGTSVPGLVQSLGYAYATTSYRENGLAILPGADDLRQLTSIFDLLIGKPRHTYIVGASEGGLIATLLAEQSPQLYDGGLAACGPIGDFRLETDYIGDFRVLFDYFFPGVIPGSAIAVPAEVIDDWTTRYAPAVAQAMTTNPAAAQQLITTTHAATDPADPIGSMVKTAQDVLWYSVFATNDAAAKLGGNPYDNRDRWYSGSSNDLLLNLTVHRYAAAPMALAAMQALNTSGNVTVPLVTLHTTGDDVIPFWQEILYATKVHASGRGSFIPLPVFRYGHCTFTTGDLLAAFGLLALQVTGAALPAAAPQVTKAQAQRAFGQATRQLAQRHQDRPAARQRGRP